MTEDKSLATLENGIQFSNGHTNLRTQRLEKDKVNIMTVESCIEGRDPPERQSTTGGAVVLPDAVLDKLYQSYSVKQRRAGLIWFLVASILFDIWALLFPPGQCKASLSVTFIVLILNIILCIVLRFTNSSESKIVKYFLKLAPFIIWLLIIIQMEVYLLSKKSVSPRDIIGWLILLNFLVYVTLPVSLYYTATFFGFASIVIYLITLQVLGNRSSDLFDRQMESNFILTTTASLIGVMIYHMGEAKRKRVFLEAKKSLEVKMIIEEQSAEQERLLLSVLPEHVAVKMRQDLGSTSSEPFKKIYMSRHENVSILYADIVGFTAISSTYSAQDLVKMLNELFARFDRLAEKYQQLRIKILGDCYYCISGAPVEKPDHAVLCVHMGLSMVKAIKYVQQKTNSPVDMRVGIHTGAVLAGILGQRQWQFDVYSKDVELANKMESSGKAGRVHISNKTLGFLNGAFEVEPAMGERREEALRMAGLKTYFITKVLKPFVGPSESGSTTESGEKIDDDNEEILEEKNKALSFEQEDEVDKQEDFKKRLEHELVARDGHGNLSKDTTLFLKFKNRDLETAYERHREPYSSLPLFASVLVQCVDLVYSLMIFPNTCAHIYIVLSPMVLLVLLVFISVCESFPQTFNRKLVRLSKKFNDTRCLRSYAAITICVAIGCCNLIDMYYFSTIYMTETFILGTGEPLPPTDNGLLVDYPVAKHRFIQIIFPSYLSNFAILILIAISVIAQLTHMIKIVIMTIIAGLHCYFNFIVMCEVYQFEDKYETDPVISNKVGVSAMLLVAAIALSLLARHMDREDRVIFKWKTEVAEQKEMATDMSKRNEALVYNVLPVHVAEHFMRNKKRSYDELYSQSYSEVGVLFASMPNFADFYSEESVNNQGLECLRFLNEVISDFDALLELPQFQDIIKIKTIGSTYMGASGINIARNIKPEDSILERWAHLSVLVEFAFELKKALQGINEQSFNHFVLKMGINHGPITAGVIGARKPHYDIWGNTVNVASRMESTGKAGAIQVTEETCNILKEFGYTFEQRGLVSVKGKGQLMTFYLTGREKPLSSVMVTARKNNNPTKTNMEDITNSNITKPNDDGPNSPKNKESTTNSLPHPSSDTIISLAEQPEPSPNETEEDSKTPLLNNINVEPSEFSEKDSLIASDSVN